MTTSVETVGPDDTLIELDRALVAHHVGGAPVVKDGKLLGVVSRSDIARQLAVEQTLAEHVADFYRDPGWPTQSMAEIGALAGQQLQSLKVSDLMTSELITVSPDDSLADAARTMMEHGVHRLLVTAEGALLGVLSSQDLVSAIATGRVS